MGRMRARGFDPELSKAKRVLAQPYVGQLAELLCSGAIERGGCYHVCVYHDDDCPILRGGLCSCEPEVRLVKGN